MFIIHIRTYKLKKEDIAAILPKSKIWLMTIYVVILLSYNFILLLGYKYTGDALLMKPTRSLNTNWILINGLSTIMLLIALFSSRSYAMALQTGFVIQWVGQIVILFNQFIFTFHHLNMAISILLCIICTFIVFFMPKNHAYKEASILSDFSIDNHTYNKVEEQVHIVDKHS
jgi:hypothetical protein